MNDPVQIRALLEKEGMVLSTSVGVSMWPMLRNRRDTGLEKNVSEDCMLGVLAGFWRGERKVDMSGLGYRLYVRLWCFVFPVRALLKRVRGRLMGFAARIRRNKTKN